MKTLPLDLCAPGYWDITANSGDGHLNMYSQKCGNKWRVRSAPGLQLLGAVPNNHPCRGGHRPPAKPLLTYSVHGNTVYRSFGGTGIVACTGTLDNTYVNNQVEMCSNLQYLFIVDGMFGYYMDFATEAVTKVTDANFPTLVATCAFLNARFIVGSTGSDTFYESQLDTPITWTPIVFAEAEVSGDSLAALVAGGDRLHALGVTTYQVFYPSDGANPLVNVTGASLAIGAPAGTYNWVYFKEALYFMGSPQTAQLGQVFRIAGGALQKISTPGIERYINRAGLLCIGFCYTYEGQDFYELVAGNGFVDGFTVIYNISSDSWHIQQSPVFGVYKQHRLRTILGSVGFDQINGNVYSINPDYNTENGTTIRRSTSFVVEITNDTVFHNKIRVALEVRLDSGPSGMLNATLRWSDDGGATFNTGYSLAKAVVGISSQRIVLSYDNLGSSIGERRYTLTFPDFPGAIIIRSADITLDKGGF